MKYLREMVALNVKRKSKLEEWTVQVGCYEQTREWLGIQLCITEIKTNSAWRETGNSQ